MKKLSRITLAKTYDVLSENEMKRIVGGMGSGSGSSSGHEETMYNCSYEWTKSDGTVKVEDMGMVFAADAAMAVQLICKDSTIANCNSIVSCV